MLDTFTLGGIKAANVPFGLIVDESGPFEDTGVDGCFGLAFEQLSSWGGRYHFVIIIITTYSTLLTYTFILILSQKHSERTEI